MVRVPDSPRARWSEDLWNKSNTNILILGLAGPRTIGPSDYRTLGLLGLGLSDPHTIRICNIFQGFHTHTHTHTRRAHAHTHVLSYIHIHTYTRIQIHSYTMIHTHTHTHTHARTHAHFLVQFNAPVKIISLIETMQISRWVKAGEPRGKPPGTPESRSYATCDPIEHHKHFQSLFGNQTTRIENILHF